MIENKFQSASKYTVFFQEQALQSNPVSKVNGSAAGTIFFFVQLNRNSKKKHKFHPYEGTRLMR